MPSARPAARSPASSPTSGSTTTSSSSSGEKLAPGSAALIALGQTDARDKLIERVKPYGGEIIQTSLDHDEEERSKSSLGETAGAG